MITSICVDKEWRVKPWVGKNWCSGQTMSEFLEGSLTVFVPCEEGCFGGYFVKWGCESGKARDKAAIVACKS